MALTDPAYKNAKCLDAKARECISDSGGLSLEVTPNGSNLWRWKYRFGGKEKRLALGICHEVSLAQARRDRDATRAVLKEGTILRVDPRELTEIRLASCRYCWGIGHRWQYTDSELEDANEKHEVKRQARIDAGLNDIGEFNLKGGSGYDAKADPDPECPSCGGAGRALAVLKDSRRYSPAALALFGGVRQTKEGIELKVINRCDALNQLARHVGFFDAERQATASVSINPVELDAIYAAALESSKAGELHAKCRVERLRAKGIDI